MDVHFSKYQGAGNDFVAIDNREGKIQLDDNQRQRMCDRHFGIGSDGLLEIQSSDKADFRLVYYNADGREGSLCGNGSRCALAFALKLGIRHKNTSSLLRSIPACESLPAGKGNTIETNKDSTSSQSSADLIIEKNVNCGKDEQEHGEGKLEDWNDKKLSFLAVDGIHIGGLHDSIRTESNRCICVYIVNMKDLKFDQIKIYDSDNMYLNNGSPHHIAFVPSHIDDIDVVNQGRKLRYELYGEDGSNINFVAKYGARVKGTRHEDVADMDDNLGQIIKNSPKTNPTSAYSEDGCKKLMDENELTNRIENDSGLVSTTKINDTHLFVRTYERGVENETLACGTGCVAVAIADYIKREVEENRVNCGDNCGPAITNTTSKELNSHLNSEFKHRKEQLAKNGIDSDRNELQLQEREIRMPGGNLKVTFSVNHFKKAVCNQATIFTDITLSGPAEHVFDGVYTI